MGSHGHRHAIRGHRRNKRASVVTEVLILTPTETRRITAFQRFTAQAVETSSKPTPATSKETPTPKETPSTKETPTRSKATPTSSSSKESTSTKTKDVKPQATTSSKSRAHTASTSSKASSKEITQSTKRLETKTKETQSLSTQITSASLGSSSFSSPIPSSTSLDATSATVAAAAQSTSASSKASGGLSTGATAGIAGVAVALVLILSAVGIFFYRKKKSQGAYAKTQDEKSIGIPPAAAAAPLPSRSPSPVQTITSEKAPRVSLRPVTQFLPNLNVESQIQPAQQATMDSTVTSNNNTLTVAAVPISSLSRSESRKAPPPALKLSAPADEVPNQETETPLVAPSVPKSPTPSGFTEYSVSSVPGTPVTPAAPGSNSVSPVHRVQMDFAPSMGDELGLRAGQLVRILHEYDDGWALCVRLDRSQQGVCPRTCLSQRPVKPRPHGPPPPGSLTNRRPVISTNIRPQSPVVAYKSPVSPNGSIRSQSPSAQQFPQPNGAGRGPASPVPRSPGGGYQKPKYVPASGRQSPHSPVTPKITISPSPPTSRPGSANSQHSTPPSPSTSPRPAVALTRPSPLSHETVPPTEPEATKPAAPAFHAM
ncbi:hypothetical protein EDC01DRAFT_33586 [Geopyxis carbonaria]|nr:hypothetical protein EDC01DRAFT_33586 [Geopyxis carbonaria]